MLASRDTRLPEDEILRRMEEVHNVLVRQQAMAASRGEPFRITDPMIERLYYRLFGPFNTHWKGTTPEQAMRQDATRAVAAFKRSPAAVVSINGRQFPAWADTDRYGQLWMRHILRGCRDGVEEAFTLLDSVKRKHKQSAKQEVALADILDEVIRAGRAGRLEEDARGAFWCK